MRRRGRAKLAVQTLLEKELFFVPPGHFYSPIVGLDERDRLVGALGEPPAELPGIDLRDAEQMALIEQMLPTYAELPWGDEARPGLRYRYDNVQYTYSDAIFYFLVLRHLRPSRVVEIGSGWSSAVALDVNERFLDGSCDLTFVEPYPDRLRSLTSASDIQGRLVEHGVQEVPLETFASLGPGDVLFIDSTHVSRAGSDVNYLFFEILPALAPGVLVHVHDVQYPFEYPASWIREGRSWNEAYLLRAFLQYNQAFRLLLCNTYLETFHRSWFAANMPLCLDPPFPTGSVWLERVAD